MSIETARIEVLAVAEELEELAQGVAAAAGGAPHDPAGCVVGDVGQVPPAVPVGDLIDADLDQAVQTTVIQVVGRHQLVDPPDRVPSDAQQRLDLALGHPLGAERDQILKLQDVYRAPRRAHGTTSTRTPQSRQSTRLSSYSRKQR